MHTFSKNRQAQAYLAQEVVVAYLGSISLETPKRMNERRRKQKVRLRQKEKIRN